MIAMGSKGSVGVASGVPLVDDTAPTQRYVESGSIRPGAMMPCFLNVEVSDDATLWFAWGPPYWKIE
jgi:hypothetical protein